MKSWLLLAIAGLLVGCSSGGTESGNPTRGCGIVRCVCQASVFIDVTDSSSGTAVGTSITVDGQSYACSTTPSASECTVFEARLNQKGTYDLTVSAPGYREKTLTVEIPTDSGCCQCAEVTASVMLDLLP